MSKIWKPVDHKAAVSHIGEGVHTGLRKGAGAPGSPELWKAIADNDEAWHDAVEFFVYGLEYMGMALCEKVETEDTSSEDAAIHVGGQS